jgi:hypothetical protein
MTFSVLALRVNEENPDHHLWNNNGNWWLHYTVRMSDGSKRRIRKSLRTKEINQARRLRDGEFSALKNGASSKL